MLAVMLTLDRMHCHVETDNWFSSEPYLWTVFFHADINTVSLGAGNGIATFTPHADSTARGLFPNNVKAGDDVPIPASLGSRTTILDDGGIGIAMVGVLFVLLEEDQTPAKAIRAGHQALASAADAVLNDYINSKVLEILSGAFSGPTPEEIQMIADSIQGEVEDAIKSSLSWYHVFLDHDDLFGFGYQFWLYNELVALTSETPPEHSFSSRIRHEKAGAPPKLGAPPGLIINDYEIFGKAMVRSLTPPPPDPCPRELDAYRAAVNALNAIDEKIEAIKQKLSAQLETTGEISGSESEALLAELAFLRSTARPAAADALESARAAYEACRNRFSPMISDYLATKEQLVKARAEQSGKNRAVGLRSQAVVGPGQPYLGMDEMRR